MYGVPSVGAYEKLAFDTTQDNKPRLRWCITVIVGGVVLLMICTSFDQVLARHLLASLHTRRAMYVWYFQLRHLTTWWSSLCLCIGKFKVRRHVDITRGSKQELLYVGDLHGGIYIRAGLCSSTTPTHPSTWGILLRAGPHVKILGLKYRDHEKKGFVRSRVRQHGMPMPTPKKKRERERKRGGVASTPGIYVGIDSVGTW